MQAALGDFLKQTRPDELMVNVHVFDQAARRHSLALTAAIRDALADTPAPTVAWAADVSQT